MLRSLATAALAATALGLTAATPAASAPVPAKDETKVLDWLAVKQSDTKPFGPLLHAGADWTVFGHLHENDKGKPGKKIGDVTAQCTAVKVDRKGYVTQCQRVLRTDDGSITLTDTIDRYGRGPHGGDSVITGGSGAYEDAEGKAEVALHGHHAFFKLTLED
ncbi:hypothetical protein ACIRNI_10055 [Streptomyces sp. NPDC093546]|uniref:hypothetical protein n=1 Tax=Streptomyces sp. NPDC093546 TaxID=3366040 RepID=UPI0038043489